MRRIVIALLIVLVATAVVAAEKKVWVCPMSQHAQEFDKPGSCPICGMALVEKETRFKVAVLVFDYAEDIDFTAPIEVLGHTGAQIFTVAAKPDPIRTVFGMKVTPDYDLAHAPAADLILVPGGGVGDTAKNPAVLAWLNERSPKAKYVMSVCNGAFILAKAGLLDGLTATTTSGRIEELAETATKTKVVRERYVDNFHVITTAGLSAGIDGALHVVDRQFGRATAEQIARGIEYRWDPASKWTRAALADSRFALFHLSDDAKWDIESSSGDTEHWELRGRLHAPVTADQMLTEAVKQITAQGWTLSSNESGRRTFTKKDRDGVTWEETLVVADEGPLTTSETVTIRKM